MKHFTLIRLPDAAAPAAAEVRLVKFDVVGLRRRALRRSIGRRRRDWRAPATVTWQRRPPRLRLRRRW